MKYYTGVVKNMCPMCGRTVYLKVTEDKQDEYDCYSTEHPNKSIQSALPSFDKFEREFIKTGYCPVCQKKIFCAKLPAENGFFSLDAEVNRDNIREDAIDAFLMHPSFASFQNRKDWIGAIRSECAQELTVNEKLLFLEEFDLLDQYKVSEDGTVVSK